MSVSEKWLWTRLKSKQTGYTFKRQVPVGRYILDFYCPAASLCVEVDGEQHSLRKPQDTARDNFLSKKNIHTIRIPSLDLFEEDTLKLSQWITLITEECSKRAK